MLVSFATYNLWLDWKKIAPHLARLFLDYEPGIHYPQLQMQSGTTGINAMRVYNVTKQGKDQDPNGVFIRKYVPELRQVPNEHIHEPWKMSLQLQRKLKIRVATSEDEGEGIVYYQKPIVDEKETAKVAKDAISAVRKQVETREVAGQVYQKHGSRKGPSDFGSSEKMHPSSATKKRGIALEGQQSIKNFASNDFRSVGSQPSSETKKLKVASDPQRSIRMFATAAFSNSRAAGEFKSKTQLELAEGVSAPAKEKICSAATNAESSRERKQACGALDCFVEVEGQEGGCKPASDGSAKAWSCKECTFENHKPHAPVCEMCGTLKVL